MFISEDNKRRFMRKVLVADDATCWLWKATTGSHGYGEFRLKNKTTVAHRISYIIHKGDIPKGAFVLHTCNNKLCVNPAHLYTGTARDNSTHMVLSGRSHTCGSLRKLSLLQVEAIYFSCQSQEVIAKEYNITVTQVSRIRRRRCHYSFLTSLEKANEL